MLRKSRASELLRVTRYSENTLQSPEPGGNHIAVIIEPDCASTRSTSLSESIRLTRSSIRLSQTGETRRSHDGLSRLPGLIKSGGGYQEKADKESWAAMKKCFKEVLGR